MPTQPLPFEFVDTLFDDSFTGHDVRHVHAPLTNHVSNHVVGHNRRPVYVAADDVHCIVCERLLIGEPDYVVPAFDFVAGVGHKESGLCCSEPCTRRFMRTENMQLRGLLFKTADIIYAKGKSPDACGGIAPHRSRLRRYGGTLSTEEFARLGATLVRDESGVLPLRQGDGATPHYPSMRMYTAPLAMAIHTTHGGATLQAHAQVRDELLGLWWDAEQHRWQSRDTFVDGVDKRVPLVSTLHAQNILTVCRPRAIVSKKKHQTDGRHQSHLQLVGAVMDALTMLTFVAWDRERNAPSGRATQLGVGPSVSLRELFGHQSGLHTWRTRSARATKWTHMLRTRRRQRRRRPIEAPSS